MNHANIIFMSHSALYLYAEICRPVCEELGLSQTAFDILMFLGNHPDLNTARDITKYSSIKKNLVSMNVERLAACGFLTRHPMKEDRRQIRLCLTEQAMPIVEKGHRVQKYFYDYLVRGLNEEELAVYGKCMRTIADNVEDLHRVLKENEGEIL